MMDPMAEIAFEVTKAALRGLPALIEAIRSSGGLTEAEREAKLAELSIKIPAADARVQAVPIREV